MARKREAHVSAREIVPAAMSMAQPASPLPDTPDWVPGSVRSAAEVAHWGAATFGRPEQAAAIVRLVTDARMKSVWRILSERPRRKAANRAVSNRRRPLTSWPEPDEAAAAIFNIAPDGIVMEKSGAQRERRLRYLAVADELDRLANEIWSAGIDRLKNNLRRPDRNSADRARQIRDTAKLFRKLAAAAVEDHLFVIHKDHGARDARALAIRLGTQFKAMFGDPLANQIAIIASVAFEGNLRVDRVRIWLRAAGLGRGVEVSPPKTP